MAKKKEEVVTVQTEAAPTLKVRRAKGESMLPVRATAGAAGADLYLEEGFVLRPGEKPILVGTGVHVAIPEGMVGLVFMRSSIADVAMTNGVGVIDSDYRGQIMLKLRNTGNATAMYSKGERIAQLVLVPFAPLPIEEVEHLPETARGEGGFGSTGR